MYMVMKALPEVLLQEIEGQPLMFPLSMHNVQ